MRSTFQHWLTAFGVLFSAGFWSIEFLWRTDYYILCLLLIPAGLVYFVVHFVISALKGKWIAPVVISATSLLSFAFMSELGMVSRRFWLNQDYYLCRMAIAPALRYCKEAAKSHEDVNVKGATLYRASIDLTPKGYLVIIDTCCGPTLETVVISSKPMTNFRSKKVYFHRKDDLGNWYLVER